MTLTGRIVRKALIMAGVLTVLPVLPVADGSIAQATQRGAPAAAPRLAGAEAAACTPRGAPARDTVT